jgi:hypothetical protein
MICKLCHEDKILLKNSHIIPNFLYKGLFDEKHKIVSINLNDFSDATFNQTGYKDKDILCAKCDNEVIGKLEQYASNAIYGNHSSVELETFVGDPLHVPYIRFKNLDYSKIKLFFLSILWKSHISKHPFFREINLGSKYSERLRKMILMNDPGPEDSFEVILVKAETNGTRPTKSIIEPRRLKDNGNTTYIFHINEIMYHYNISNHNKMSMFDKSIIKRDGILDIAIVKDDFGSEYFDSFIGKKLYIKPKDF